MVYTSRERNANSVKLPKDEGDITNYDSWIDDYYNPNQWYLEETLFSSEQWNEYKNKPYIELIEAPEEGREQINPYTGGSYYIFDYSIHMTAPNSGTIKCITNNSAWFQRLEKFPHILTFSCLFSIGETQQYSQNTYYRVYPHLLNDNPQFQDVLHITKGQTARIGISFSLDVNEKPFTFDEMFSPEPHPETGVDTPPFVVSVVLHSQTPKTH